MNARTFYYQSNFDGGTYSRIRVERAAIFELVNGDWTLKHVGKIILSK